MKFLYFVVLFVVFLEKTDAACTFPSDISGTWQSSRWGDMVFSSSSQVSISNMDDLGSLTFDCEVSSGSLYVIRSTTSVNVLGNTVDVASCMDMTQITSGVKYIYYHATTEVTFTSGATQPVKLISPSSSVTTSSVCDVSTPYTTGSNHMLIASGQETAAATQCPNPLLATFDNYTIDVGSGAQCSGVGYISICDNLKNITIDYSVCSTTVMYSSGGSLECVYYSSSGSTYYVNVYNFDATVTSPTTYRFTCLVVEASDPWVLFTQYPLACDSTQTATSVPSSPYQGGVIQASANLPSSSDSGSDFPIIIIIIVILLLIIILVAVGLYVARDKLPCRRKRGQQVDPNIRERDMKASSAPADSQAAENGGGGQKGIATTAVVSNDAEKRLMSSQSTRSVATPSKLQTELHSYSEGEAPTHGTPRRLPPLESSLGAESESSDGVSLPPVRLPPIHETEPVYQNTPQVAPTSPEEPHVYDSVMH